MNESRLERMDRAGSLASSKGETTQQAAIDVPEIFSFLISLKKAFSLLMRNFSIHRSPFELSADRSRNF